MLRKAYRLPPPHQLDSPPEAASLRASTHLSEGPGPETLSTHQPTWVLLEGLTWREILRLGKASPRRPALLRRVLGVGSSELRVGEQLKDEAGGKAAVGEVSDLGRCCERLSG